MVRQEVFQVVQGKDAGQTAVPTRLSCSEHYQKFDSRVCPFSQLSDSALGAGSCRRRRWLRAGTPGPGHRVRAPPNTPHPRVPPKVAGCSGRSFSFPGLSHFPSYRSRPPRPGNSALCRVPVVPPTSPWDQEADSCGSQECQKCSARREIATVRAPRPSPRSPSRNSLPWTLAPQLIHSRGAGPPSHAGTDVRTRAPARPKIGRAPESRTPGG